MADWREAVTATALSILTSIRRSPAPASTEEDSEPVPACPYAICHHNHPELQRQKRTS
jgi:hypothetical protein